MQASDDERTSKGVPHATPFSDDENHVVEHHSSSGSRLDVCFED